MNQFKQALMAGGAIVLSATVFVLTLPLVLFMASALFLTGVAGALILRYQMRKLAESGRSAEAVIIEGTCRTEPLR